MVAPSTLLFRVGERTYGCPLGVAQEIIPVRQMTRLPGAPPFVRGLINLRGTIVTVLDLGPRLDPTRAPTQDGSILLVRHGDRFVGLVVDEVADVRALEVEDPQVGADNDIVSGVATVDGAAAVILDLHQLITQVLLS